MTWSLVITYLKDPLVWFWPPSTPTPTPTRLPFFRYSAGVGWGGGGGGWWTSCRVGGCEKKGMTLEGGMKVVAHYAWIDKASFTDPYERYIYGGEGFSPFFRRGFPFFRQKSQNFHDFSCILFVKNRKFSENDICTWLQITPGLFVPGFAFF